MPGPAAEVLRQTERLLTQSAKADEAITAWADQLTPEQRATARGLIEQYQTLHHQALDALTAVLLHWPSADPPAAPSWRPRVIEEGRGPC